MIDIKRTNAVKKETDVSLFFVYIHTVPNGKVYVGSTKRPFTRWDNGNGYRENKEFYDDIVTYGWDNIKHEIIISIQDSNQAKAYEKMFIILLDAENPQKGYNKTTYKKDLENLFKRKHIYEIGEESGYFYELYTNGYNPFENHCIPISQANQIIDEWIYSERDRAIAKERFCNGKTTNEIGKIFNVSGRQIQNIVTRLITVVENHI